MRDTINDFGRKVTALFKPDAYCTFAPPEETLGVIDTSGKHDGSRGIAFLCDEIRTNFGGRIMRAGYKQVTSVTILKSYETTFDDELQIDMPGGELRISDCSLNKFFLKQLINSLCRLYYTMSEDKRVAMRQQCTAAAMEHFAGNIPAVTVKLPNTEKAAVQEKLPETEEVTAETPAEIPDGRIVWLSGKKPVPQAIPDVDKLPEDMSQDEAMSYLLDSINEINDEATPEEIERRVDEELDALAESAARHAREQAEAEAALRPKKAVLPPVEGLTEEPQSDDIYIKASKRLRLFCAERQLTMEQIENAVKDNMVSAAENYSRISAEHEIPPLVAARAQTLKNASDELTKYFALGEDIAARVMFFMLYQMLSYADRIAELPETKERLNDFFRRYGSAAMALSLLDSGI